MGGSDLNCGLDLHRGHNADCAVEEITHNMQVKTVYYLLHRDTGEPCFRTYHTRAAARIAQRNRNRSLGFLHRVERVEVSDNWEVERCRINGEIVVATYVIGEAVIEIIAEELE